MEDHLKVGQMKKMMTRPQLKLTQKEIVNQLLEVMEKVKIRIKKKKVKEKKNKRRKK